MPGGSFFGSFAALATLEQIDAQIGAGHAEYAVLESDIGGGDFEHMRGKLLALADDDAAGLVKRGAADGNGA